MTGSAGQQGQDPGPIRRLSSGARSRAVPPPWIQAFGASEAATHCAVAAVRAATIPVGMWAGWSLFGRRAGMYAATLFAFSPFLTQYARRHGCTS